MATARGIWTSAPLRQSLAMAALFALVSLVSLAATYVIVSDNTEQSLRATLEQEMASFRALPNAAAVVTFVRSQSQTASPKIVFSVMCCPEGCMSGMLRLCPIKADMRLCRLMTTLRT